MLYVFILCVAFNKLGWEIVLNFRHITCRHASCCYHSDNIKNINFHNWKSNPEPRCRQTHSIFLYLQHVNIKNSMSDVRNINIANHNILLYIPAP